jgi:hypothetical protein
MQNRINLQRTSYHQKRPILRLKGRNTRDMFTAHWFYGFPRESLLKARIWQRMDFRTNYKIALPPRLVRNTTTMAEL